MPTYPQVSDSMAALSRADGTTKAHSDDHGHIIGLAENVKHWGAKGDGATDDTAAIQAALNSGTLHVFFPAGAYFLADGSSLTIPQSMRLTGAGRRRTQIYSKNAYAFTSTSVDNMIIEGFGFFLRSGATTGGAIRLNSAASTLVQDIEATGLSTSSDPVIYGKGVVGVHFDRIQIVGSAGGGLKLDTTGSTLAFCNANTVYRVGVTSCVGSTSSAIYTEGTKNIIRDCDLESNRGYGIQASSTAHTIEGTWFEDQSNHNIHIPANSGASALTIRGNNFAAHHGDIGTARHISLGDITNPSSDANAVILGNQFQDQAVSGINLYIGTNWEHVVVIGNRKLWAAATTDNGSGTQGFGNWDPSNQGLTKLTDILSPPLRVVGTTEVGDNSDLVQTGLFAISDSLQEDQFGVLRTGHAVFHTKNVPSSPSLPTNSMILYWDNAAGQVKAFVRKNDGSTTTVVLG